MTNMLCHPSSWYYPTSTYFQHWPLLSSTANHQSIKGTVIQTALTDLTCYKFSFFKYVLNPHLLSLRQKFYLGTLRFHYMVSSIMKSERMYHSLHLNMRSLLMFILMYKAVSKGCKPCNIYSTILVFQHIWDQGTTRLPKMNDYWKKS
jgi:hypothetical protein